MFTKDFVAGDYFNIGSMILMEPEHCSVLSLFISRHSNDLVVHLHMNLVGSFAILVLNSLILHFAACLPLDAVPCVQRDFFLGGGILF